MRARGGVLALMLAVLAGPTSACSVDDRAVVGLAVSADGSPMGVLQVCSKHIDGVTIYQTDNDHLGTWTVDPAATGFSTWSLVHGGSGWTVETPLAALKPGQTYDMYGWTKNNTSAADGPEFTPEQLAALKPGQVLWDPLEKDAPVVTLAYFRQHACDRYN